MADDPKQRTDQQQKKVESRAAEATEEAAEVGNTVIQAADQFQDRQMRTLQQNLQRWQDVQVETFRTGADILFIQMEMMNRLTSCRRPDQVVGIGEDAIKATQERVLACMDQYRDLASRQYEAAQELASRQ